MDPAAASKPRRRYQLTASRYGGEHTIGTLDGRTAWYWLRRGPAAFKGRALGWDEDDEVNDHPLWCLGECDVRRAVAPRMARLQSPLPGGGSSAIGWKAAPNALTVALSSLPLR